MGIYRKYVFKYKLPFLTAVICVTLEAFCDLLGPTLMANIINYGIQRQDIQNVLHWGVLMLLVTAAGAGFAVTRSILASRVSQRVGADLRRDLFAKILRFSEASADQLESGSLITRMTSDTSQITQFVNGIMRIFLKAPVTCIGSILLATILNPRLSVVIYGIVVFVAGAICLSMKLSYPRFAKLQLSVDRINCVVQEYLIGVRLVKAFGTYDEECQRFEDANSVLMKRGISSQIIITFISPLMTFVVGLGTVLVIYLGEHLFSAGLTGAGDISAMTLYMSQILSSLLMITNIFNTFVRTKASTARIQEVLNADSDFPVSGAAPERNSSITFDHVTFSYPGSSGLPALKDLSFSIRFGENLAIIGPTGSGKSTIAWLLLRFYDPDSGCIRLGLEDIRKLSTDALRKNIAIVPQKAVLFSGTVAENLRWGSPSATDGQLRHAAAAAQADFIDQMPEGYESLLGSGGVNLSGGQRQRISIARALVANAPFLLLDDATSALDPVTEEKVRTQLMAQENHPTMITITQKCSTAMSADRILVMENGVQMGFGTHTQLMESCQIYQDIYHSQVDSMRQEVLA